MTIAALIETANAARKSLDALNSEMEEAIRAETRRIQAEFRDRRTAASQALSAATKAVDEAKIAASATNPLVGKKVSKTYTESYGYRGKTREVTAYGIVEVVTPQTDFPANMAHWRRPDDGALIVRLLKKDGTPGAKIVEGVHLWVEAA